METNYTDPYEAQLLAVFESCQTDGQSGLDENGLHLLCDKLQLEEHGKELISCLLERTTTLKSVSFHDFRDGLLALLGKVQDGLSSYSDRELCNDSLQNLNSTRLTTKKYGRKSSPKEQSVDITDYQHLHLDGARNDLWKGIDGLLDLKIDEPKLRELWTKLNIGSDQSELPIISHFIGIPTLSRPVVEQIFEKLDVDHDGRISLEEFFLIFKSSKILQEQLGSGWITQCRTDFMKQDSEKDSIQIRGPHHTGCARSNTIVDMWEVAGVTDAATLLAELGFTSADVNLTQLTTVLSEELKGLRDESDNRVMGTHISLLKAALVLYQEEVRILNTLVEHLSGERDKLRGDITEANQRASLLAQEVDENHVRLEKSSQNQIKQLELKNGQIIKDLTDQLSSERETNATTLKFMDQRLQTLQNEDQRLRTELANVLAENHTLETENQNLSDHLSKLRLSNNQLQIQIQMLAAEHDEDANADARENELVLSLMGRIKKLQSDNALLRDQYDELTSEVEGLKNRDTEVTGSSEIMTSQEFTVKQPATSTIDGQTTINDSEVLNVRIAELEKLLETRTSSHESPTVQSTKHDNVDQPKNTFVELKNTLVMIKVELANVLSETKNNCTCENCSIRHKISEVMSKFDLHDLSSLSSKDPNPVKSLANELEAECEERASETLRDLVINKSDKLKLGKKPAPGDDTVQAVDKNASYLDTRNPQKNKMTSLRDYPPRRDENGLDQLKIEKNSGVCNLSKDHNDLDKITEILKETEEKHSNERKILIDRCSELERSLELLRSEYEQCEDYWAGKLEEERQLFEQEQQISDEKFSDLIAKMTEYEEQFGSGEKNGDDGRLSPIEERFNLEQQYTDLEEEYKAWKSRARDEQVKKDEEIHELRAKLQLECNKRHLFNTDFSMQFPDHAANVLNDTSINSVMNPTCDPSEVLLPVKEMNAHISVQPFANNTTASVVSTIMNESPNFRHTPGNDAFNELSFSNSQRSVSSLHGCNCYQLQPHTIAENLCRGHREELRRLHQLKVNTDAECVALMNQKELLTQEILKLQSIRAINCTCSQIDGAEQACRIDLNVLQTLNTRLQTQEQKCRHLQTLLKQQQQHTERILHQTWKQHRNEVNDLQFVLRSTQEKLQQHLQAYKEQGDKLARSDLLAKDLYLENTYLLANVERLEQHCHILTQYNAESTSV